MNCAIDYLARLFWSSVVFACLQGVCVARDFGVCEECALLWNCTACDIMSRVCVWDCEVGLPHNPTARRVGVVPVQSHSFCFCCEFCQVFFFLNRSELKMKKQC